MTYNQLEALRSQQLYQAAQNIQIPAWYLDLQVQSHSTHFGAQLQNAYKPMLPEDPDLTAAMAELDAEFPGLRED